MLMGSSTAKALVFVVEDNDDVRNVIAIYLRRNGYAVAEASDGIKAIESLSRLYPDVILLDVLLPKLDGIGVLNKIREQATTKNTPVVMMSAVLQTRDLKSETAKLNVSSFVQKPFQMRTLLENIERAMEVQRKSDHPPPPRPKEATYNKDEKRLQMERTALEPKGRLERTPVPELLHSIFIEFKTGRLRLCSGATEKLVFFQNGLPMYAESSIPEETLGAHLKRKGLITPAQHSQALEVMTTTGRHFGEVLLKLGLIGPHDLFTELEAHLTNKVISVFGWHNGDYEFEEGDEWKDEVIVARMKPGRILLAGVQQYWPPALIQKRLRITDLTRTFPLNDSPYGEEQRRLSTHEMKVEQLVKRGMSVGEIMTQVGDLKFAVATLYGLYVMESVGFILSDPPAQTKGGPVRSAKEREEFAKILLTEYLKFRTADYFKLLGVTRGASKNEIDLAFQKRKKRYHPDTLIGIDTGLVHEKIEELYVRIHDAYKTLMDPASRQAYVASLDKRSTSTPAERSSTKRFSTMQLIPEHVVVFEEGFGLLRGGNYARAKASFTQAFEIEPLGKYKAYAAWASYLADPQNEFKATEETLQNLRQAEPEESLHPYLLGRLALKMKNEKRAIGYFDRALRLDPQHIDSARQLRILRMRSRNTETSGLLDIFKKEL